MAGQTYANPYTPQTPIGAGLQNIAVGLFSKKQNEAQDAMRAAQATMYGAHEGLYAEQAKKASVERQLAERLLRDQGPDAQDELIAASAGVPVYTVRGYRDTMTGANPGRTIDDYADVAPGIRRGMLAVRPAYADKTINPVNIAQALDQLDRTDTRTDVIAGRKKAKDVAQGFFATSGHAPYAGSETGSTSLLTGEQSLNPIGTSRAAREKAHARDYNAQAGQRELETRTGVRIGAPVVVEDPEAGTIFTAPSAAVGRTPGRDPNRAGARGAGVGDSVTETDLKPIKATDKDLNNLLGAVDRAAGGQLADKMLTGAIMDRAEKYFSTPGSPHYGQHEASARAAVSDILPGGTESPLFGGMKPKGETRMNPEPIKLSARTTTQKTVSKGGAPAARQPQNEQLPPAARSKLRDGVNTTFGNGQVWTLMNGAPSRVK